MNAPRQNIDQQIRTRFIRLLRFVIADLEAYGIANQQQFCAAIGIHPASLSRFLNDESRPVPVEWVYAVGMVFDVDTDWIVTGRGAMPQGPGRAYKKPKLK